MNHGKSTSKNVSQKQEACDKCQEKPVITSYGKILCASHGLEHMKEMEKTKKNGIYF